LIYATTFGIFKYMFDKMSNLKYERFREFAEKYYGGILKNKIQKHLKLKGETHNIRISNT